MRRRLRFAALVGLLATSALVSTSGSASADDAQASRSARALELFEKSERAYETGRFADAIALLRQSYDLEKEPVLLYNMGRAYEGLGDLGAAAASYESFLRAVPHAPDRGALERRIATLHRQLAEREALERDARQREAQGRSASAVPWIVAGVGVAGIVTGTIFGVMAGQRNDDAKLEPTYVEAERLQSQAESHATVANVGFIAGGVLLAIGVVWGVLDLSASKGVVRARPTSALSF